MKFNIPEFQNEKEAFFVFYEMLETEEYQFTSDDQNYIVGRGNIGYPIWIWTKNNCMENTIQEIEQKINEIYLTEPQNSLTTKKELYEVLKNNYIIKNPHEIDILTCQELQDVPKSMGFMDKADYRDKIVLAEYWKENIEESFPDKMTSIPEILEEVEYWIETGNFYVWRDITGKAVSMANYTTEENMAKISYVYTPKDERGRGYCRNLIYHLTKLILEKQYIPILYTESENKPAIHIYQKIGYNQKLPLMSYTIIKE